MIRGAVKKISAVDEGKMMHLVHTAHRLIYHGGIADIAGDELNIVLNFLQASWCTPRIVVKHANGMPLVEERLYECGADKATAAGDENRATLFYP